jgi:ABC-type branched-subunit amino acid transport system substrate-binding protein
VAAATFALLATGVVTGAVGSAGAASSSGAVKIMLISQVTTGAAGAGYPEIVAGVKAGAAKVNAEGGINGKTVEVQVCDTKGEPTGAVKCANQAVQQNLPAVVGVYDLFGDYLKVLEGAGIPSIGPYAVAAEDTSPMAYSIDPGGRLTVAGLVSSIGSLKGVKSVAFTSSANPAARAYLDSLLTPVKKAFPKLKINHVELPQNVVDASAAAASAEQSDGIAVATFPRDGIAMIKSLKQSGASQPISTSILTVTDAGIKQLGKTANGLYAAGPFLPGSTPKNTAVKEMNKWFDKVDKNAIRDDHSERGYIDVQVFAQAARRIKGDITGESVRHELDTMGDVSLAGLAPPINFSKPVTSLPGVTRLFSENAVFSQVKNGKWIPLNNGQFVNMYDAQPVKNRKG